MLTAQICRDEYLALTPKCLPSPDVSFCLRGRLFVVVALSFPSVWTINMAANNLLEILRKNPVSIILSP